MASIVAGPKDWVDVVAQAPDGTTIELNPGTYPAAWLSGIRKSAKAPVIIDGGGKVTFDGGVDLVKFGAKAADAARWAHKYGRNHYPGVYSIAHEATLKITGCSGLAIRG